MSEQPQNVIDLALKSYLKSDDFEENMLNKFIGIEIIRRIIGLAQLPLTLSLEKRIDLLKEV